MHYSPADFLHSLVRFMVERAGAFSPPLQLNYADHGNAAGEPRDLWRNNAVEERSANPHSVLRIYGGPGTLKHPKPVVSVQVRTSGSDDDAALNRAQALFETLLEDDGEPLRMRRITAYNVTQDVPDGEWMLVHVDFLQRPGMVGRDEHTKRAQIVSSFDVGFYRLAARRI